MSAIEINFLTRTNRCVKNVNKFQLPLNPFWLLTNTHKLSTKAERTVERRVDRIETALSWPFTASLDSTPQPIIQPTKVALAWQVLLPRNSLKKVKNKDNGTYRIFFLIFFIFSNGGSDKQHMDSSSDSEMDNSMHDNKNVLNVSNNNNNNNTSSHNLSATASTSNLTAQTLQMQLTAASSHHIQQLAPSASSLIQSAAGSSKNNLGQLSSSAALSAVAYSHLHSVMGNMPIYDMTDYQHLWLA